MASLRSTKHEVRWDWLQKRSGIGIEERYGTLYSAVREIRRETNEHTTKDRTLCSGRNAEGIKASP